MANEPGRCQHETSLVDIGAGKSYCARLDRWTNCREAGHCVADDLLGEETDGEDEA